ncbi:efflux RND transporter periplasmic adaptor subunit [Solimicrobium silvestre]|uniref:Efflux transporter, RND family, MFP subunit n=1 Tax=Solimicrobium silvestre TaxID=2099400 RepID=A0A2S9GTW9_9BURK|nr:efflux RND transporter periplasmic adaptor subunit [Solimicrobium silvestre]PRC91172.1 Efflux transporter, RND family, MFP subunit [Solimicrobium silvestre]
MTKRLLIMLGCIVVLIAGIAFGFYLHIQKLIASSPKPSAQTVTTTKVAAAEWQPQLSSVGTVTAYRGVDVTSEIAGLVREIKFKSGQHVKKGDLLIALNADSDIAQLQALEASAELAATVLKRDEAQLAVEGVSQAQVDADKADLKNKRALVAQQTALVEKKTIRAPFAGRLGITAINPGQYVNPGDKLVTLQTIDPIYVNFSIPQKQSSMLKVDQNLKIISDAYPEAPFAGKVNAINPVVDASSRNVQVQAKLSNEKQQLLPGMFANVSLDVGDKNKYITLPQTAITYNPYGSTVFVVKQGKDDKGAAMLKVNQVFVTTGATRGDQVAITKGLEVGQEVVTSGQLKLKNDTWIVVDNSVLPANDPNPTPQEH